MEEGTPSSQWDLPDDASDTNICLWTDCGESFSSAQDLGQHLSSAHVGKKMSIYTCEWHDCLRNGEPLPNRFALIAHLRRHTGERPFKCKECSRSFSRSDALSKHMKAQHSHETATEVTGSSPTKLTLKLRRKLEYLETERSLLTLELQSVRTKIKRIRAEKLVILDILLDH